MAAIYDRFMRASEEACLSIWRAQLLGRVQGRVLEIGAGTGVNLEHYPSGLDELVLLEPDRHMRRKLGRRVDALGGQGRLAREIDIRGWSAEQLAVEDERFDAVVATLVLCSVGDLRRTLGEIHRVLRPGGRLLFLEHVAAGRSTSRLAWQRAVEPMWKHVAGNCHLTRQTAEAIEQAGFSFEHLARESMRKALPIVRPTIRGVAVKRS